MTKGPVFVTRPAEDAGPLVELLRAQGHEAVPMPALAIEALDDPSALVSAMARLERYRLATFVSPNAIRLALAHRAGPWPPAVAIGVMGPGSVAALRAHGIAAPGVQLIVPSRYDSEGLFDELVRTLGVGAGFDGRVLLVRGAGGRPWFADRLRDAGVTVDEVESYRRVRPTAPAEAVQVLRRAFAAHAAATFVVTSSEAVDHLVAIVDEALDAGPDGRRWLYRARIVAPHPRIADRARSAGFADVVTCETGDRGIVASLE